MENMQTEDGGKGLRKNYIPSRSKELRYILLTFTIFVIQSQVGAIPVFSRLCTFAMTTCYFELILSVFARQIPR